MAKLAKTELRLVAQELGLIESTSARQEKNGTMAFVDPVTSSTTLTTSYTVHSNGYIRRNFEYRNRHGLNPHRDRYQLNRTHKTTRESVYGREYTTTDRIMATPLEQVAILFKSTINFRKNKNNK